MIHCEKTYSDVINIEMAYCVRHIRSHESDGSRCLWTSEENNNNKEHQQTKKNLDRCKNQTFTVGLHSSMLRREADVSVGLAVLV